MKKTKVRKTAISLGTAFLMAAALPVYGENPKVSMEDFQKVADEYAAIMLRMDAQSALVDTAYESIEAFLDDPTLPQQVETEKELLNSYEQLFEYYKALAEDEYEMPDEIYELLDDMDIVYEEFVSFASGEASQVEVYMDNLYYIYQYMSEEEADGTASEELAYSFDMLEKEQEINRKYMYITINYWFAGCSDEEQAYVQETVTEQLASFCTDGHEWDQKRDDVEARLNTCLDEQAELNLEWEKYLGEKEAELNQIRQELEG